MVKNPIVINFLKRSGGHLVITHLSKNLNLEFYDGINIQPHDYARGNQHIIFSSENIKLPEINFDITCAEDLTVKQFQEYAEKVNFHTKILLIRAPSDLVASRIRGAFKFPDYSKLSHCKEFFLHEKYLLEDYYKIENLNNFDLVIDYDEFITQETYREKILYFFEKTFSFDDSAIQSIPNFGGGSSFVGINKNKLDKISQKRCDLLRDTEKIHWVASGENVTFMSEKEIYNFIYEEKFHFQYKEIKEEANKRIYK